MGVPAQTLPGWRNGQLVAIKPTKKREFRGGRARHVIWEFRCDCGRRVYHIPHRVKTSPHRKGVFSCGRPPCKVKMRSGLAFRGSVQSHGQARGQKSTAKTQTWLSWWSMIQRCTYPSSGLYRDYGAKGIRVCRRWLASFSHFLSDMGKRPAGALLVRIDTKDDYYPGNVEWRILKRK